MSGRLHLHKGESAGWTKAEFDAAPEAITRLHRRILDLEGECDRLLGILSQTIQEIGDEGYSRWSSDLHQEVHNG